ncbi:MAG: SpaA isopeptide-forming pilin-related protein, partial [Clostridia bacterium]
VTNTQNVTVTAGNVASAAFTNDVITAKIRIVKKDQQTKEPLAGAEFTVTRLSAPAGRNGIGEVVAVFTTDASGTAETDWLDWGRYRITETKVPPHFVDNHFSTEIDAFENGKTYVVEVENEPSKGWIRLTKADRQNGNPIAGIQFDIYCNDEYGGGFVCSMVTGADGVAMSEPLRKGRYIVKEHGATAGYVFEEVALDATVKSDETTELTVTNQPVQVRLKLYKRDADEYDGDNPNATAKSKESTALPAPASISAPTMRGDGVLTCAEFQVLAGADITDRQGNLIYHKRDIVITSLKTTGEDASVTTDNLWPGLYEIMEITPPAGYHPSDKSFFVDARSAAAQSIEAVVTYEGLKTNEIMMGLYAIVKFLGDNEVHDDAGIVET